MFERLVPVSREQHGHLRIRPATGFGFSRRFHLASLAMQEFARASAFYPIVFLDDREREAFRPVALLGVESGENLFLEPDDSWLRGAYIPGILRRYPFALADTERNDEYAVCVDADSGLLDEREGMPMFSADGSPTETLENVKRFLGELQQMDALTLQFAAFLARHNLLRPLNLRVQVAGSPRDIAGSYVVNEERLDALSDSVFLEMRNLRYLQPLYAHLSSLPQIDRLVRLKEARGQSVPLADASAPAEAAVQPAAAKPRSRRVRSSSNT
jgi:hypothetical protein